MHNALREWVTPERRPLRAAFALGLLHAIAMALAFPPLGLWPLALLSVWPLTRLALRAPRERLGRISMMAALGALPFWIWTHQFVLGSSAIGFYPLVLYLAFWPGLFVWLLGRVHGRLPHLPLWLATPTVWVGLEYLRGEIVWNGYAWYLVGQPLIDMSPALRYAPIFGMYGASVWLCLLTGWWFDLSRWWQTEGPDAPRVARGTRVVGIVIALGLLGGITFIPERLERQVETVRVGIVQTNLAQGAKGAWRFEDRLRDFERFAELSIAAAASVNESGERPAFIVWPETMFPGFWLNEDAVAAERHAQLSVHGIPTTDFRDRLVALSTEIGMPIVVGAIAAEGVEIVLDAQGQLEISTEREFNSAFVVAHGAVQPERYDKMHLTPFGEVMPYIQYWPWLQERLLAVGARGMSFGLSAGEDEAPLVVDLPGGGSLFIATPICFEATVQEVCRQLAYKRGERRADMFVALTNDGWFHWHSAGRYGHLLSARWRSAELGIAMVRAANTGVSAVLDRRGRILASGVGETEGAEVGVEGILVADVPLPIDGGTFFGRHGDIAGRASGAGLLVLLVVTFAPRRKLNEKPAEASAEPAITRADKGPR